MITKRKRTKRAGLLILAVTGALLLIPAGALVDRPRLLYNHTPSVPMGFYLYDGNDIERGDTIAFPLPAAAHAYALQRGESVDVLLLKPVLAMAGNRVSTLHGELRINGVPVGAIPSRDSAGRLLPRWRAARVLTDGELFVGSTRTDHSFDSRFFGPIHVSQVVGVYRPLRLCSPDKAPPPATDRSSEPTSPDSRLPGEAATARN